MIDIHDKRCTGCTACYNICPKHCISMREDDEGFLYPYIDKEKCINCGLCKKVCQMYKASTGNKPLRAIAAINRKRDVLLSSSSGGIFSTVANYILKNGGVVCGAAFDEKFKVKHIFVENKEDLKRLYGSKYVQSEISDTYTQIKEYLKKDVEILFSGTSCQVEGLKAFLGDECEKLYTIDVICHGVPNQKFFDEYLNSFKRKIVDYNFRYKLRNKNVNTALLSYKFENGKRKIIENVFLDPYYFAFYGSYNYRDSCYNCKFANLERVGDITLGDFWGAENYHKIPTNDGVSAVMINSEKGIELLNKAIHENVVYEEADIENIKKKNNNLQKPAKRPLVRDNIYRDLNEKGFKYISKKYLKPNHYILVKLKSFIPIGYKMILKEKIINIKKGK